MPHEEPSGKHHGWSDAALDARPVLGHRVLRRLSWALVVVLVLVLMVVLPPLVNVGRYQRRIAQDISAGIGRPVHFDDIHLHLLPLPGLTIQNFVVQEAPGFGFEPILRANTVEARLRLSSLWRRRIEVSRIDLQAPSINLVRAADGRWNFQGVVTQAGTMSSAPTAQRRAGGQPRFPYIEASEARVNVKIGETKLPWSLVDADLALWLPDASEWRVRLRGRPLRTDTDVSDVGELHVEGSLGRETSGQAAGLMLQPLALSVRWASTPLGEAAKLLLGRDTGFRGAASAEMEVRGTPARMRLSTDLHLHNLRRAEFVPRLPMSVNAHCLATADSDSHALQDVRCAIPTAQSSGLFDGMFRSDDAQVMNAPDVLAITGDVPDVLTPASARVTAVLQRGDPAYVLNWLRVASSRIPEGLAATGTVLLRAGWHVVEPDPAAADATAIQLQASDSPLGWFLHASCTCTFTPAYAPVRASTAAAEAASGTNASAVPTAPSTNGPWSITATHTTSSSVVPAPGIAANGQAVILSAFQTIAAAPTADQTAPAPEEVRPGTHINGTLTRSGVDLTYDSPSLARYASSLLPPLGDDLPRASATAPIVPAIPITSVRVWGQPQTWTQAHAPAATRPARSNRHHR